jgi:hypothetical protein
MALGQTGGPMTLALFHNLSFCESTRLQAERQSSPRASLIIFLQKLSRLEDLGSNPATLFIKSGFFYVCRGSQSPPRLADARETVVSFGGFLASC